MTPAEIRKLTDDFAAVVRALPAALKILEEEYSLSDKAICDIRHYAEFNKTTRTEDRKLVRLLRGWSLRRRNADDAIRIIKPLSELVARNNSFFNELDRIRGEMKKAANYVDSERHYNPRVLHDLFGGAK
jgi:hypothetical protein